MDLRCQKAVHRSRRLESKGRTRVARLLATPVVFMLVASAPGTVAATDDVDCETVDTDKTKKLRNYRVRIENASGDTFQGLVAATHRKKFRNIPPQSFTFPGTLPAASPPAATLTVTAARDINNNPDLIQVFGGNGQLLGDLFNNSTNDSDSLFDEFDMMRPACGGHPSPPPTAGDCVFFESDVTATDFLPRERGGLNNFEQNLDNEEDGRFQDYVDATAANPISFILVSTPEVGLLRYTSSRLTYDVDPAAGGGTYDEEINSGPGIGDLLKRRSRAANMFDVGKLATEELEAFVLTGNPDRLRGQFRNLENSPTPFVPETSTSVCVGNNGDSADFTISNGGFVEFEIIARSGDKFSFVSNLMGVGNVFTGLDKERLPSKVGRSRMFRLDDYDAGDSTSVPITVSTLGVGMVTITRLDGTSGP